MEIVFKFYVHQLIGEPEFGVDVFVEFYDSLVEFCLRNFWGLDEEGDPFVSSEAVEVGGVEVISIDEVASSFIKIGDDVDLVSSINVVLRESLEDKSDESSFFVEGSISTHNFVESEPGELTQNIFVGFFEGIEFGEILDFLPFFIRGSSIENFLINFQDRSFFNFTIVVGFIVLLK